MASKFSHFLPQSPKVLAYRLSIDPAAPTCFPLPVPHTLYSFASLKPHFAQL